MDLVSNLNLGMWIFCGFVDDCLVSSIAWPFLTFIAVSSKTCSLKSSRVTETGVFFYS